ncbi:MAG: hypothetical protein RL368_566 [Pseudomonadota bacterium]|jgi:hypothetical protein
MSLGADFIAISEQKLSKLQDTPKELCNFLRKEGDEKPSERLCIDDAWDILAQTLDKLNIAFSTKLQQLTGLPCAEMAFYLSAADVALLAKQLTACDSAAIRRILKSLDYEEIYHGERWREEEDESEEEFLEFFENVSNFFEEVADKNAAIVYLLT